MKIIKLAVRSILSFKTYSGINLIGLALCLACVITIFRYVYGEFTVDRFNKNLDRMYVTVREYNTDQERMYTGYWPFWSGGSKKQFTDLLEHPGVENYSLFAVYNNEKIALDGWDYNVRLMVADSNFLKVTTYPLVSGDGNLSNPNSVLITESFAKTLFGDHNPVGKTLHFSDGIALTISGVIGKTTTKTTLSFDVIVSYYFNNTWDGSPQTIVLLHPGIDYQTINKQFESFDTERNIRYQLFPLSKVYFEKSITDTDRKEVYHKGNYTYILVLIAVGLLILFIGVINYVNIYTVVVLHRGRELGVKKVFGTGRHHIFLQLLVENIVMTGIALFGAFILTNAFNPLITKILHFDQINSIHFDMLLSFILLITLPVIAILFPFFRYCFSTPVNSFRNFDKIRGGDSLRTIFLSFQYLITMTMIIVSLFFVKQLYYMLNSEPGYRTNDIIKAHFFKGQGRSSSPFRPKTVVESDEIQAKVRKDAAEIERRMNASPLFTYWTYGESPNKIGSQRSWIKINEGDFKEIDMFTSDEYWLNMFDIQLKEGRLWDKNMDVDNQQSVIVTESFIKLFGISDFNDLTVQSKRNEEINMQIVGVVKDFSFLHLSQKSVPIVLVYTSFRQRYDYNESLLASVVPGRMQEAIAFLRKLHDETVGGEFNYTLVEDEIREMYSEDRKIASIYSIFTLIAIFVSALGLFSMSLFDIQKRRKEIAIRKINGATLTDIIRLLLKKYFWTLTISFVIAAPVALYAINRYLEGFANKATVSWWLFAVAFVITAGVSLLTLIYQTRKAANQNPAEEINK